MTKMLALCVYVLCGSTTFAQNYQCNWSVLDMGGGMMNSTNFQATPSVGQTAIGQMTGASYQAFIGFWQIDTALSGVREESHGTLAEPSMTALCAPAPNPFSSLATIRYSLATESRVSLGLYDLTGRCVDALLNAAQKPGQHSILLTCRSSLPPHHLSRGVYFLKMCAGDYQATRKLIIE